MFWTIISWSSEWSKHPVSNSEEQRLKPSFVSKSDAINTELTQHFDAFPPPPPPLSPQPVDYECLNKLQLAMYIIVVNFASANQTCLDNRKYEMYSYIFKCHMWRVLIEITFTIYIHINYKISTRKPPLLRIRQKPAFIDNIYGNHLRLSSDYISNENKAVLQCQLLGWKLSPVVFCNLS